MVLGRCLNPRWRAECKSVVPPRPFELAADAGVPCPELVGKMVPDDAVDFGGLRMGERFFAGVAGMLDETFRWLISIGEASRMVARDVLVTDRDREARLGTGCGIGCGCAGFDERGGAGKLSFP